MEQRARYVRQQMLPQIGPEGQRKLEGARLLLLGCGALGCTQAQLLARAGIGKLRLVDRDVVETSNLQRQLLYDEQDARDAAPKAEAAARHLRRINSSIEIEARVADISARNIVPLLDEIDLVLDATDNIETRYLLNDACVERAIPWIYGGAVETGGLFMAIRPGDGACLRCLFPERPEAGGLPTCDSAGVLGSATTVVAAFQVAEALRLLVGALANSRLYRVELWPPALRAIEAKRDPACKCCGQRQFDALAPGAGSATTLLCGERAVQVSPPEGSPFSFDEALERIARSTAVKRQGAMARFHTEGCDLLLFSDGRAVVRGTADPAFARSLVARIVGL